MIVLNLQVAFKCKNLSSPSISNNLYEENDYQTLFFLFPFFFLSFFILLFYSLILLLIQKLALNFTHSRENFIMFWRHSPTRKWFPLENFVEKSEERKRNISLFFILIWNLEISSFNQKKMCVCDVNENKRRKKTLEYNG